MEQPNFLHVDKNSQKLEVDQKIFWFGHGQKWVWRIWSQDCI